MALILLVVVPHPEELRLETTPRGCQALLGVGLGGIACAVEAVPGRCIVLYSYLGPNTWTQVAGRAPTSDLKDQGR